MVIIFFSPVVVNYCTTVSLRPLSCTFENSYHSLFYLYFSHKFQKINTKNLFSFLQKKKSAVEDTWNVL